MNKKFTFVLNPFRSPMRIAGKEVVATLNEEDATLDFRVTLPNRPTAEELRFVEQSIEGFVDALREEYPHIKKWKKLDLIVTPKGQA